MTPFADFSPICLISFLLMRSEGILNSSNSSLILSLCVPKDIHSVVLGQIFLLFYISRLL